MYWRSCSASCLSRGGSYIYFASQHTCISRPPQTLLSPLPTYLIERECRITRHSKVGIQRQIHDILSRLPYIGGRANLAQRLAHKQDAIDEQTVCGALDLKVSEEGVCAEEREDFVEGIVAVGLGVGRLVGR